MLSKKSAFPSSSGLGLMLTETNWASDPSAGMRRATISVIWYGKSDSQTMFPKVVISRHTVHYVQAKLKTLRFGGFKGNYVVPWLRCKLRRYQSGRENVADKADVAQNIMPKDLHPEHTFLVAAFN